MARKKPPRKPTKPKARKPAPPPRGGHAHELLDVQEAADLLKVSKPTFYRWLSQGTVPGFKVGGQWRFRPEELQRFIQEQGATITEAPAEIDAEIEALLKQAGPAAAKADREARQGRRPDQPEGESKVVRLANLIIKAAIERRASDIHFEPTREGFAVRYRVDGVLHVLREMSRALHVPVTSRLKLMADLNLSERRVVQEGRIHLRHADREYDLRISVVPAVHGESLAVRILDRLWVPPSMERQGFTDEDRERIGGCMRAPTGLIIFTGPAGCGKTTTAYSWLQTILSPEKKTLCIEDPVEYTLPWATQVNVNRKVGLTYESAVRSFMRQDPDVIFAGAITDLATAEVLLQAVITGHLALTTLYAVTAPGVVTRLLDMGCEPFMVGESLICVVAQRLARRVCGDCTAPQSVADVTLAEVRARAADGGYMLPADAPFRRGKGCDQCRKSGYYGRIGLFEVMVLGRDLGEMIAARRREEEIRQAAIDGGMKTLFADGLRKAAEGITTVEEVLRVTA